jgi:hypothetical protein
MWINMRQAQLFKGEVCMQRLAVLKERHERRMVCLLKLNN